MGADPVLVRGAYEAAGGVRYQQLQQQAYEEYLKAVDEAKNIDINMGAQRVVDTNGDLPVAQTRARRNELAGPMLNDYQTGDDQVQEEKEAEVLRMAEQEEEWKAMRLKVCQDQINNKNSNINDRTPLGQEVLKKMTTDGEYLVKKNCPEGDEDCQNDYGVNLTDWKLLEDTQYSLNEIQNNIIAIEQSGNLAPDVLQGLYAERDARQQIIDEINNGERQKWHSLQEMSNMIVPVDQASINTLEDLRSTAFNSGFNTPHTDEPFFDEDLTRQTINNALIGKGNFDSMVYDPMIPAYNIESEENKERSFYTDMYDHVFGEIGVDRTYGEFGITDEMIGMADANTDSIIDENEAETIVQGILRDKPLAKKEFSNYLLTYLRNNHELGVNSRPKPKNPNPAITNLENQEKNIVEERKNREDINPQALNTDWD